MAYLISVDKGLVVRFGTAVYRFIRFLDQRASVQFENEQTGEYKKFDTSEFYRKLQKGELTVVVADRHSKGDESPNEVEEVALDTSALTEDAKQEIDFRHSIIKYLKKIGVTRGQRTRVAEGIRRFFNSSKVAQVPEAKKLRPPSPSSVMAWMRDFELSGSNIASLLSGNSYRKRTATTSPAVEETMLWALDTVYLTKSRPTLNFAYECLLEKLGKMAKKGEITVEESKVSLATFQRRKDDLDPYTVNTRRYSADYGNQKLRATFRGTTIPRAMARLEVDHTMLNYVVVCDRTGLPLGRPTLTVVIDSYSGYVVGFYVSFNGPGITSVLNAMKNSIRPKHEMTQAAETEKPWIAWGIGDTFLLDNGMEFHSKIFRHAAWELSADIEYCTVRTPWLKPKVERFFATLEGLPLFTGRVLRPTANVSNLDPKKDAVITLSRLCEGLVLFVTDIHAFTKNSRTLALPYDLFAESIDMSPPPQIPLSMENLDLIAAMSKQHMVDSGGVDFYGLQYAGYDLLELLRSANGKFRTLIKWDPDDLGLMYVQHSRTQEWVTLACTRGDYASGLTWNQHRLIRKFTREQLKESGNVEHLLDAKLRLRDLWMEPLAKKNRSLELDAARKLRQLAPASSTLHSVENTTPRPTTSFAVEEMEAMDREIPAFESMVF